MTVHFIGAGPGARRPHHAARARPPGALPGLPLCGLARAEGASRRIARPAPASIDTAPMTLDEIEAEFAARPRGRRGRGAAALRRPVGLERAWASSCAGCDELGIPYTITPGVPSFAAAAAALGRELTLPEVAQSVVLTRMSGPRLLDAASARRSPAFAATGATLAIHLADPCARPHRGGAHAALRRGLPGRDRVSAPPGRTSASSRARSATIAALAADADRAHGADPGRAGARRRGFPRERALRPVLSASLPRRQRGER